VVPQQSNTVYSIKGKNTNDDDWNLDFKVIERIIKRAEKVRTHMIKNQKLSPES
jgi:hypothetical protein